MLPKFSALISAGILTIFHFSLGSLGFALPLFPPYSPTVAHSGKNENENSHQFCISLCASKDNQEKSIKKIHSENRFSNVKCSFSSSSVNENSWNIKKGGRLRRLTGGSLMCNSTAEATLPSQLDDTPNSANPSLQLKPKSSTTEYIGQCHLPTDLGEFRLYSFRYFGPTLSVDPCGSVTEPVVLVAGDLSKFKDTAVPVRIHDQCFTSEVLGSQRCDCKEQLEMAKSYILKNGGAIIYMQQEGRGIGLANKIAAYELQDQGLDTVDANRHLGFQDDYRSYECVPFILNFLGIKQVQLMTNNPYKVQSLKRLGIPISSLIPLQVSPNSNNEGYLRAKAERMKHRLTLNGKVHNGGLISRLARRQDKGNAEFDQSSSQAQQIKASFQETTSLGPQQNSAGELPWCFGRESVLAAIESIQQGGMVVVVDDTNRENEGDFIMAAEKATPESIAFIIRHSSGVICCALENEALERLGLPQMVPNNEDPKRTAFTITVDAKSGVSTGISAADRAHTMNLLASASSSSHDFVRPGHIFPLRACAGGVLSRDGHTEASVDLCKLAGLQPVGVLCEIVSKDSMEMARLTELQHFSKEHNLVLTSIQDLICYRKELLTENESH